ncbi:MAG: transcriptional regulator [Tannerellaceae bacterium]|nr:transcriptional regulator [Tannerellaceae bacterium]
MLSVAFDRDHNLWLGLDNGIDHITLNSPFTNLYFSPYSKGAGYCWLEEKGRFYLGTNRGLFTVSSPLTLSDEPADFSLIPELSGQVWDLEKVGEELLCFHDKGLYVIRNGKSTLIPGLRGSIAGTSWPGDPQKYWVGTYEGLYLIQKENTWKVKQRIEGISYWWRNMASEAPGILWVRSQNSSVSRIELDTIHYTVQKIEVFGINEGFASVKNLYIHTLQGHICFSTSSGIYTYDPEAGRMKYHETLNSWFLPDRSYTVLKAEGNSIYALSADLIQIARFSEDGKYLRTDSYPFNYSRIDFIPYYEELEILNDSLLVIPNEHGYALLNTRVPFPVREDQVVIQSVYLTYPKDSLIYKNNYQDLCSNPVIPYTNNSIRFEYAFSSFSNERSVKVRYRLLPDQAWSDYTETGVKEYTNLHEGKYIFEVEALFPDGEIVSSSYSFTIQPPWFRSGYAYLMAVVGFLLLLGLFYKLAVYRTAKKRKEELEEKEKELFRKEQEFIRENLRKEKAIIRLENEKLEQALAFKNQELANLMIHLSRKNEILTFIKQDLHKVVKELQREDPIKAKRMLLTLSSGIDLNMQSEEVLKRFEEQFDLVHNNFIRKLTEKYPDLNISERKMCAYLKMNLTSKEIAPLLNLSLRGVETLRYRLRKKLGLGREDNLMDYLNQFV